MKYIVVCKRVSQLRTPVLGSTKDVCSHCKEPIWVGPLILIHPRAKDAEKLCLECLLDLIEDETLPIDGLSSMEAVGDSDN